MKGGSIIQSQVHEVLMFTGKPIKEKGQFFIQTKTLGNIFQDMGILISEKEFKKMMNDFDQKYKDGKAPISEIEDWLVQYLSTYDQSSLLDALQKLDADKDGKIQYDELKYYMENFGDKIPQTVIDEILALTEPKDGFVNLKQFCSNISAL